MSDKNALKPGPRTLSEIQDALNEIAAARECERVTSALIRNMGVPGGRRAFNPRPLELDHLRKMAETRISGALGIPPWIVQQSKG
jgi:hypothetical protein